MFEGIIWDLTDIEGWEHEYRIGLDTRVVHAVNDEY